MFKPEPYIHMFWCVNQWYLPKSLWIRPLDCLSWQQWYICTSLLWGNCVAEVVIFVTDTLRLLFSCLDNWKDSLHRLTFMLNNKTLFVTRYTGLGSSRSLALGELLQFNDQFNHDFLLAVPRGQHILTPISSNLALALQTMTLYLPILLQICTWRALLAIIHNKHRLTDKLLIWHNITYGVLLTLSNGCGLVMFGRKAYLFGVKKRLLLPWFQIMYVLWVT